MSKGPTKVLSITSYESIPGWKKQEVSVELWFNFVLGLNLFPFV